MALGASTPWYLLTLHPLHGSFGQVLDERGQEVGNLRLMQGRWKFKAIGLDEQGRVVPGGGPLRHRHNLLFDWLDENSIVEALQAEVEPGAEPSEHRTC